MIKQVLFGTLILIVSLLNAQLNEYTLKNLGSPFPSEEVQDAFAQLGLSAFHYSCDIGPGYDITLVVEKYKKGKYTGLIPSGRVGTAEMNINEITLYVLKDENQVSFKNMFKSNSESGGLSKGTSGTDKVNLYNFSAQILKEFGDPVLKSGEKTPIFLLAINKNSISGKYLDLPIDEITSKYDMVLIVYFELEKI